MLNTGKRAGRPVEFRRIPVSRQGQVTLPKALREHLGIMDSGPRRITISVKPNGAVVIEPEPTVDALFGILKASAPMQPADVNELRGAMRNERLAKLGYAVKEPD